MSADGGKKIAHAAIMTVASLSAAVILFYAVFSGAYNDIYKVFGDIFEKNGPNETEIVPGDGGRIYDSLMGYKEYDDINVERGLPLGDATELLRRIDASSSYRLDATGVYTAGNSELKSEMHVFKRGEKFRVSYICDGSSMLYITDGEKLFINDVTGVESCTVMLGDDIPFAAQAGIIDVDTVIAATETDGITAECSLIRSAESNILYIKLDAPDGSGGEYWVSVSSGAVLRAVRRISENVTFQYSVGVFDDGSYINDDYFIF